MKVVATLACRVQSTRLYAKPLQFIDIEKKISILEYLVDFFQTYKAIDEIVLAISEGEENLPFIRLAERKGLSYIIGSQEDVQERLIMAAEKAKGDIVYRVTTECPFIYMETFNEVLTKHCENKASLTRIEGLPKGAFYELISLKDLERAHDEGERRHRSELCTLYMLENQDKFRIQMLEPDKKELIRPDIRITVDYPEDLIVVREVYKALKREGKFVSVPDTIKYLDDHPTLNKINSWIEAGTERTWN